MFFSIKAFIGGYTSTFYLEEEVFEKAKSYTLGRSTESLERGACSRGSGLVTSVNSKSLRKRKSDPLINRYVAT